MESAIADADMCLVRNDWPLWRDLTAATFSGMRRNVVDGRRILKGRGIVRRGLLRGRLPESVRIVERCGLTVAERPISLVARRAGRSKLRARHVLQFSRFLVSRSELHIERDHPPR